MLVFVMYKGASNTPLSLAIADYREGGKKSVISLRGGLNVITPANSGNGYIQYWTRDECRRYRCRIFIFVSVNRLAIGM